MGSPAALFDALDLLHQLSQGAFNGYTVTPVPEMARFPMRMHISRTTQVNFADSSAGIPTQANWHLLNRFGQAVGDRNIVRHARWMATLFELPGEVASHYLRSTFHSCPLPRPEAACADLPAQTDLPAALGGIGQCFGKQFAARNAKFSDDGATVCLSTDIAGAYPSEAGLESCLRTAGLHRGCRAHDRSITIADRWRFTQPQRMAVVLIPTAHQPAVTTDPEYHALHLRIGPAIARIEEPGLDARVETIALTDPKLPAEWGDHLYRTVITQRGCAVRGSLTLHLQRAP